MGNRLQQILPLVTWPISCRLADYSGKAHSFILKQSNFSIESAAGESMKILTALSLLQNAGVKGGFRVCMFFKSTLRTRSDKLLRLAVFTLANPDYRGWAKSARFHGLPPAGSGRTFRLDRSSTFSSSIARIIRMGVLHSLQKSREYQKRCSFSNLESNITVVWVLVGQVSIIAIFGCVLVCIYIEQMPALEHLTSHYLNSDDLWPRS